MKMKASPKVIETGKKRNFTKMSNHHNKGTKNFNQKNNNNFKQQKNELTFTENNLMTYFENCWILKENLEGMKSLSAENKQKIIVKRKDGNKDPTLTSEEKLSYCKMMKSERKKQVKQLKRKIMENKPINRPFKMKKPGKYLNINISDNKDLVKFKGYFIKKDGYDRIIKLIEKMKAKGTSESEIEIISKYEGRKEVRRWKKEYKQKNSQPPSLSNNISFPVQNEAKTNVSSACFKCNSTGHFARNCPENDINNSHAISSYPIQNSSAACFKCNSTDHFARNCPENDINNSHAISSYPIQNEVKKNASAACFKCNSTDHFARNCPENDKNNSHANLTCFKCNQVGHLSRNCPDISSPVINDIKEDKCCDVCGSSEHLRKYCPEKEKKQSKLIYFD